MSITFTRVEAPDETWSDERHCVEIVPTLPVVLGRGSLLKCGEKKISRHHAYLDWDDDDVILTSSHQNPTFVLVKGVEKRLTEGDSAILSHGDKFGLLKETFWFRINLPGSSKGQNKDGPNEKKENGDNIQKVSNKDLPENEKTDQADGNSQRSKTDSDTLSNSLSERNGEDKDLTTSSYTNSDKENEISRNGEAASKEDLVDAPMTISAQELQSAVLSRKRELPSWLSNLDASKCNTDTKEKQMHRHGGNRKPQTNTAKGNTTPNVHNDKTPSKAKKAVKTRDESDDESSSIKKIVKVTKTPPKTAKVSPSPCKKTTPAKKKGSPVKNNASGLHALSDEDSDSDYSDDKNSSPKKTGKVTKTPPKTAKVSPSPRKKTTPAKKKASPAKNNTSGLHAMSDEDSDSDYDASPLHKASPKKAHDVPKTKTPPKRQSPAKRTSPVKHDISDEEMDSAESDSESNVSTSKPIPKNRPDNSGASNGPRTRCQFGSKCYRKNPEHLSDYAHVGDSDYLESDSDDPDDERPQCEYGVDCYRKNPKHRKEYKHSRLPQPQRKAKRKARNQKQNDNSDSDEYDYDDPFLNDGSSDDYAPTDDDSDSPMEVDKEDEEEDTKRMLKEGKKFVKKR